LACFSCFVYMISSDDAAFPLPLSLDLQQWPATDDDAPWLSVSVTTPHTLAQSIFLLLFILFYLYIKPSFLSVCASANHHHHGNERPPSLSISEWMDMDLS
jgi:hypothetical protein